jgi:hypothetical protein
MTAVFGPLREHLSSLLEQSRRAQDVRLAASLVRARTLGKIALSDE